MIYLASPYSDPDPAVREHRWREVCRVAASLMSDGHHVLSPIAHSHPIAEFGLPGEFEFWQAYDEELIGMCGELWVLTLPGWRKSVGVKAEMEMARASGMPVRFIEPPTSCKAPGVARTR